MRKLVWLILGVVILWVLWWGTATFALRTGIETWFEDRREDGFQAEYASHATKGFPLRIHSALRDIAVAQPERALAIQWPALSISAPAYWPGDITVTSSDAPIVLATPNAKILVQARGATADLRLHPGTALELERMSLRSGVWSVARPEGTIYGAQSLSLSTTQSFADPSTYAFFSIAPAFALGDAARASLRIPAEWPVAFDRLELDATVRFDRPWGIDALERTAPQPRKIDLKLAEAAWGNLRLFAAADLDVDVDGVPTGTVNLQAENWQDMLDLAMDAGLLPPQLRSQAQDGLNMLAGMSGDPTALDVQLNFRGGFMMVGFIPVGPAPRLIIR
jgi:hypothetical protein